jgi:hypothetical protein
MLDVRLKLSLGLLKPPTRKMYAEVKIYLCAFLTSALNAGEWSVLSLRKVP